MKTGILLDHGDFTIKQSPNGIKVTDGAGSITAPLSSGKIIYVRHESGGALYINGQFMGAHYTPCLVNSNKCVYTGKGDIKELKVFRHALDDKQIYRLGGD